VTWLFEPARPWRPLDAALAAQLARRWPAIPAPVLRLLARASMAHGEGHSALDLDRPGDLAALGLPDWPAARWRDALADCPAVGTAGAGSHPFVLEHGLLYLRRSLRDEADLACALTALAQPRPVPATAAQLHAALARLFPGCPDLASDRQVLACLLSLRARLTVILGGPGTGKTTTVARLLELHRQLAAQPLRIAAAAPTGKAAARVGEALAQSGSHLAGGVDQPPPVRAQTLHRLLGASADGMRFRHGPQRPLPYDLIVLDEASMVDLALFARLLGALADDARLVILGDPDQLEAIESGAVLAQLATLARDAGTDSTAARDLLDRDTPPAEAAGQGRPGAVADCVIRLSRGYRFGAGSAIGRLAAAVLAGDADAALTLLRGQHGDLQWQPHPALAVPAALAGRARTLFPDLTGGDGPAGALAVHAGARVLCATRGEAAMANGRLAHALGIAAGAGGGARHGLPFLVTRNDSLRALHNGDTGVFRNTAGELRAWLPGPVEGLREYAVHELGPWLPALAMTVHRAQGSEYDRVLLTLPGRDLPVLSRQWLYTAITRARAGVELWAAPSVLAQTIGRRAERCSGLALRLR
jgi:exodeoxyribonuclease V alpha subunit